jgi:hypothetical protein
VVAVLVPARKDTIHNPVTGESVTFLATSADTDGEAVAIETVVQPHGFVAAAHVHPFQSERFAVANGRLGPRVLCLRAHTRTRHEEQRSSGSAPLGRGPPLRARLER